MSTPTNRTVNIFINQASAERALANLQKSADKLSAAIAKGQAAGKDMTAELEKLSRIKENISTLSDQVSGKLSPTLLQVKSRVSELRRELERMSKEAPGYAAKFDEFQKVSERFKEMKEEVNGVGASLDTLRDKSSSFWEQMKVIAAGTFLGNVVTAVGQAVTGYFSSTLEGNAKLSDSLADIAKTTGYTDERVKALNSTFSKLNTRTATSDLREIAIALGQLGVAVTPETVANIDRIVVALGDEFGGGAGEITTVISTLRNNLQDIKSGNYGLDVLRIGNALNELGASGLATAPVVTDFANRIAGIGGTFHLTSGQILGLSAVLQELGIPTERGSTALIKLLQKMSTHVREFAHVAHTSVSEFSELVNTDMLSALTKVAEAARWAGKENVDFGRILADLDADGSGAGEVLSKLANNHFLLVEKVDLASKALHESGSITEEFDKKNNNLAATLDKLKKSFFGLLTSTTVVEGLSSAVYGLVAMIDGLKALGIFIKDNLIAIGLWTAAILVQTGALKGLTLAKALDRLETIASTLAAKADIAITTSLGIAKALLTGNISKLRQEWKLLTLTMGTNPLSVLLVAAGLVAVAVSKLTDKTHELTRAEQEHYDTYKAISEQAGAQIGQIALLRKAIEDVGTAEHTRLAAIKELKSLMPEVFANLSNEELLAGKVASAYERANAAIIASSKVKVYKDKVDTLAAQLVELEDQIGIEAARQNVHPKKAPILFGQTQARFELIGDEGYRGKLFTDIYKYNLLLSQLDSILRQITSSQEELDKVMKPKEEESADFSYQSLQKEKSGKQRKSRNNGNPALEELIAFKNKVEQIRKDLEASAISEDKLEEQRVRDKYDKLEAEAAEYFRKFHKHIQEAGELGALEQKELDQLFAKQAARREKEEKERADKAKAETDAEAERLENERLRGQVSLARHDISIARDGSGSELDAKKRLLLAQFELETAHMDKTSAMYLEKEAQLQRARAELQKQHNLQQVQRTLDAMNGLVGIATTYFNFLNAKDQQQLDQERAANDIKRKSLQKALEGKRISQAAYTKAVEKLADQEAKHEAEIKHKKFVRDRALGIVNATISTAQAVLQALASAPPPYSFILAAIAGAAGAVQIGTIAATKEPKYSKGGIANGSSHADGGISLIDSDGTKIGEMEGGEPYMILSKETMRNNSEIINDLLDASVNGGGRPVKPKYLYQQPTPMNYAQAKDNLQYIRVYSQGGVVRPEFVQNSQPAVMPAADSDRELKSLLLKLNERLDIGIRADVYWNELDKKNRQALALKKTSSLGAVG